MKSNLKIVAFVYFFCSQVFSLDVIDETAGAPHFDEQTFLERVIDKQTNQLKDAAAGPWFIKFYAPWCGHCKALAPAWDELYNSQFGIINVAKVDCTSSGGKPLCEWFDVKGYPSLLFFPADETMSGKYIKYGGRRE